MLPWYLQAPEKVDDVLTEGGQTLWFCIVATPSWNNQDHFPRLKKFMNGGQLEASTLYSQYTIHMLAVYYLFEDSFITVIIDFQVRMSLLAKMLY